MRIQLYIHMEAISPVHDVFIYNIRFAFQPVSARKCEATKRRIGGKPVSSIWTTLSNRRTPDE